MPQILAANIVIIAKHLRPELYGEQWLVSNNVVNPQQFVGTRVSHDEIAVITTSLLELQASKDRVQISLRDPSTNALKDLIQPSKNFLTAIKSFLPDITAIGLNFAISIPAHDIDGVTPTDFCKRIMSPKGRAEEILGGDGAIWGFILYKPVTIHSKKFTFTLKALPSFTKGEARSEVSRIVVDNNFHCDILGGEKNCEEAVAAVECFGDVGDKASEMAAKLSTLGATSV